MYHTYHALQARSSGPEPACGSVQRHCLCLLAISGSAGWLLEAAWMSVVHRAGERALDGPLTSPTDHKGVPHGYYHYTPSPLHASLAREASTPDAPLSSPRGERHHEVRLLIGCFPQSVHRRFVHCTPRGRLDCTRARAVRVPLLDGRIETRLSYYKRR
jgi:hypothetical protein